MYICANKFLMEDFKREVARVTIDMLETAGSDAAVPEVLRLCRKLYQGLSEVDPLLKMIFARVGFLQPVLWGRDAEDTSPVPRLPPRGGGAHPARDGEPAAGRHRRGPVAEHGEALVSPPACGPPVYAQDVPGATTRWA